MDNEAVLPVRKKTSPGRKTFQFMFSMCHNSWIQKMIEQTKCYRGLFGSISYLTRNIDIFKSILQILKYESVIKRKVCGLVFQREIQPVGFIVFM